MIGFAKPAEEVFGIFPIKGIIIEEGCVPKNIFDREWTFVSPPDETNLESILEGRKGFGGNFELVYQRLQAHSLLIVKKYVSADLNYLEWLKILSRAEDVVAGINLVSLTTFSDEFSRMPGVATQGELPFPVWIPKVAEHPELPIAFDRHGIRMSGHSQVLNWPDENQLIFQPRTNETIETAVGTANPLFGRIIGRKAPANFENCAKRMLRNLDSTSLGQFTAQTLGCIDVLIGENSSSRWNDIMSYTTTLCGEEASEVIEKAFKARHEFVHRGREPEDRAIYFRALAILLTFLVRFAALAEIYKSQEIALDVLDSCTRLRRVIGRESIPAASQALTAMLPLRPIPLWIKPWMH